MAPEDDIINSYKESIGNYFPERSPYSNVHVLVLWWTETDLAVEQEINALSKVFKENFQYDLSTFQIPSDGNQDQELSHRIISMNESLPGDSLLIVYYAGHCDSDANEHARWWA